MIRLRALDGVRALAVLAVLAAHAGIAFLPGGFIGVDVFFVLSGFLITSLLYNELAAMGRIDLGAFWARRARRLLPAALVVIVAVLAARPLFIPDSVAGLRGDAIAAALWSSNWRWALHGTDYFAQGGTPSPLQHTWSLAVEEQFYVIWPLLLLVLAWPATKRWRLLALSLAGVAGSAHAGAPIIHGRAPAGQPAWPAQCRCVRRLHCLDVDALPAAHPRHPVHRPHHPGLRHRDRRPLPLLRIAVSGQPGV